MAVSIDDVKYVAELARLEFSDECLKKLTVDLNGILEYVNRIDRLNTGDVDISINPVHLKNAFRDDVIEESLDREKVLENAPDALEGYFKVPKVIEG